MTDKTYHDIQRELNILISSLNAAMDDNCSKKEGLITELTDLIFDKQIEAQIEYEEELRENLAKPKDSIPEKLGECLAVILKEYYHWALDHLEPEFIPLNSQDIATTNITANYRH